MKILIANNRYFRSGGPETYMFGITAELQKNGHAVIPFSVDYAQNLPTAFSHYFVPAPSRDNSAVYHHQLRLGALEKIRLAARAVYSFKARDNAQQLLSNEHVDVAYLLGIVNMLSPSIIDACHRAGVPVVMFLADYNLVCASYHFLRDGKVCRDCYQTKLNAIRYRCVKGSATLSATRALAIKVHELLGVYRKVSAFIAPSETMAAEMIRAGLPATAIHHVPIFAETASFRPRFRRDGPIVYVGRLAPEKGVDILIRAFARLEPRGRPELRIVGPATVADEAEELRRLASRLTPSGVTFVGQLSPEGVATELERARLAIVPSRWLENTPHVVYEAMAAGKPVIVSEIGSLREQVVDGVTGFTFPPEDDVALAQVISKFLRDPDLGVAMGRAARASVESANSVARHVSRLVDIFAQLTRSTNALGN